MPRFLISTMDAAGHVHPALPVAKALVERGHSVRWHVGAKYRALVENTGATWVEPRRTPTFDELPPVPDPGLREPKAGFSALRKLLVERMAGQVADYEELMPFDGLIVDLCSLGGQGLYERHGTPWATLGISPLTAPAPDIPRFGTGAPPPSNAFSRRMNALTMKAMTALGPLVMKDLNEAYVSTRAALGLKPLPRGANVFWHMQSPMLHMQAATPAIEYPRRHWPANVHFVGPLLPPATTAALPEWWAELDSAKAVVHVTQGTVATDPSILTKPALAGLASFDGLVVVTSPHDLGPVPANTRVAEFIPHSLLLPKVDAMVTNAGYNGVKMALSHAVPLVMAPWGNDQPDVAGRIAWAGAGVNLRKRTPSPGAIRQGVATVLDGSYHQAARRIQAEFREYPDGSRAAHLLEELVGAQIHP
ncbi:glycosyltransferase [Actinocrispum wychmicini]|uniref:UDP:flavonoid glycosyltransferase YjiC (YdhE family) n=1 Tax=Actinocrispum wychmicini TaxID=1213861 RepID=A0A4R2K106_9PSEU|nr:nucleotide disphospho-sugar-binding domain-containing protein [Actinocrispum wychmicini]TCO65332.1 UDP:flavonoid glycosyltransferase YjiC (YdhE family) [Actinocrispum wychmicini]